ncbi:MAG: SEC-C metal-binding domain-containing protein, partial [Gemmatimonadaceae bacterium]
WLPLHAAMIAGLMPTERGGLHLVQLMRRMDALGEEDLQDWLAGYWPALFLNKPDTVLPSLRELAEDRLVNWFTRNGAAEALLVHAAARSTQALSDAIDWAASLAANPQEDWDTRVIVASMLLDYAPRRHRALLERLAGEQDRLDAMYNLDDVVQAFAMPGTMRPADRFRDPWAFYSSEAIADRQRRWAEESVSDDFVGANANAYDIIRDDVSPDASYGVFGTSGVGEEVGGGGRGAPSAGRNDPCPCGSGKKYKRCCLAKADVESADELAWRRLRRVLDEHRSTLFRFAQRAYGASVLDEASRAFAGDAESAFDLDDARATLCVPWIFHFWSPSASRTAVTDASLHGVPPTAAFLARTRHVDALFKEFLQSCLDSALSVFEIGEVRPQRGFMLRDLMIGDTHEVSERSGTETMQRGDLIVGQLATAGGVTILEASQSFIIPPIWKLEVLAWRERIFPRGEPVTTARLRARHEDVVALYREIERRIFNPGMPELRNTDGDVISPRTVVFDVSSAQEAFDALRHLARADDGAALQREAEYDGDGALKNVRFPWFKEGPGHAAGMDNTVLGWLSVRSGRLTVEVNSEAREARIRNIVAEALGDRARYRMSEVVSVEPEMARQATRGDQARASAEAVALAAMPEVKRAVDAMLRKHYESWVNERLPALGGRTPLEAVADADGREAVAALVAQIERDGGRMRPPLDPAIVRKMRERLGLVE